MVSDASGIDDLLPELAVGKRLPTRRVRVLGIDLGTTNSTVAEAMWDPTEPARVAVRCLEIDQPTQEGRYTHLLVPSVVAVTDAGFVVGEGAKRLRARASTLGLAAEASLFFETKNWIGTARTYPRAPTELHTPTAVAREVLHFIHEGALEQGEDLPERVVVTVPASFQAAQRTETRDAAHGAGLAVRPGDLLDEPIAAFLDCVARDGTPFAGGGAPRRTVVFDFGGGTCDVAVLEVGHAGGRLAVDWRAVSRYHRLGGGDIDAAIVHEVLVPMLREQNGLDEFVFGFADRKQVIEPALLGKAEALKVSLCSEIVRLRKFGRYDAANAAQVVARQPGVDTVTVAGRELMLSAPSLDAATFERLLAPFLDTDLLAPVETEYRLTCSIFAPLRDALDRAGLDRSEVDLCLLVGGSSLIPQVCDALGNYLPNARLLAFPDADATQTAVARGAAWHALALALTGRGLVQPVSHDAIGIRTQDGVAELVPARAPLPWPANGDRRHHEGLRVPKSSLLEPVPLRVDIVAGGERLLRTALWDIQAPVNRGDRLTLDYRLDENQVLEFRLSLAERPDVTFELRIENPFTNVVNPNLKRIEVMVIEERIRRQQIPREQLPGTLVELGRSYQELGQCDKALEVLGRALQARGGRDVNILLRMGIVAGEKGDFEREERYYLAAADAGHSPAPLFNLALSCRQRNRLDEAVQHVEKAIKLGGEAPCHVLRALLAEKRGETEVRERALRGGLDAFDPPSTLDDWELGWCITAQRMAGDKTALAEAEAEQRERRRQGGDVPRDGGGLLPLQAQDLQVR